jgi:hypothetical protein
VFYPNIHMTIMQPIMRQFIAHYCEFQILVREFYVRNMLLVSALINTHIFRQRNLKNN